MGEVVRLLVMFVGLIALLVALGFSLVSTTTSHWYSYESIASDGARTKHRFGLWIQCVDGICDDVNITGSDLDRVRTSRAFAIMSALLLLPLLGIATYATTTDHGIDKVGVAMALFAQAVLQIIAASAYTGYQKDQSYFDESHWEYSFDMAWTSAVLSIVGGVCFLLAGTIFMTSRQIRYKRSIYA